MITMTKLERQLEHLRGFMPPVNFYCGEGMQGVAYAKGNNVLVAWEDWDFYEESLDWEGVTMEQMDWDYTLPLGTSDRYQRLADANNEADRYGGNGWEAMIKAAKRMGIEPYVLVYKDYDYTAVSLFEYMPRRDDYLIVSDYSEDCAMLAYDACARLNGKQWALGYMTRDEFDYWADEDNFCSKPEVSDECYGYVWSNVDRDGDSSPSLRELKCYL